MIKALAARYGIRVIECEIVGLTSAKDLLDCAEFYLKAKNFDCKKQVMEYHLIDME
jgi:glutamate formiminotransferase